MPVKSRAHEYEGTVPVRLAINRGDGGVDDVVPVEDEEHRFTHPKGDS